MSEQPSDTHFRPITPNPYIVGNPVRDRSMFFGREAEFELVRKRFEHMTRGGLLVFCGERRSGKTSILFQILDQRLGPEFIPVLIDMQSMAVGNEVDFLARLCQEVLEAMGPHAAGITAPEFTTGSNHAAKFQSFLEGVLNAAAKGARTPKKLILLFDEYELFENKIDSGALAEDVLYILSNLMENLPVFLVFTGSQHLEQRRREYWKILGKSIYKQISYLDRDDALSLIRKPVASRVEYDDKAVEAIYRLSAGQPFYTQAICQNLIDQLNERRTDHATLDIVNGVVEGIVNNPLPQMIFLWDGLERDEKLVLALLAETLPDDRSYSTPNNVRQTIDRREYPLELSKAHISTALDKLFKSEMLLRSDATTPPGYAFRMDLWRLWVRRMHSVWQAMREEGLEIRQGIVTRRKWIRRLLVGGGMGLGGVAVALGISAWPPHHVGPGQPPTPPTGRTAPFALGVDPIEAVIYHDGKPMGMGMFRDAIDADRQHLFRLSAHGYADSQITVSLASGVAESMSVHLRRLLGAARIETQPAGAELRIDGHARGRSPITVADLPTANDHVVEATLPGYGAARKTFSVGANEVVPISLVLTAGNADVMVTTDPPGAELRLDGAARGKSPVLLTAVFPGKHRLVALRDGYVASDTTLVVTQETRSVDLQLHPEPPGALDVQGDKPAQIYLDGVLVVENVQHFGPRQLRGGSHDVRVVLVSGEAIDTSLVIKSRQRVTFDYTNRTVTWRPQGGN